jgi:hypothetical protein
MRDNLFSLTVDRGVADATRKTLEAVRAEEMAVKALDLSRGKHWYQTNNLYGRSGRTDAAPVCLGELPQARRRVLADAMG